MFSAAISANGDIWSPRAGSRGHDAGPASVPAGARAWPSPTTRRPPTASAWPAAGVGAIGGLRERHAPRHPALGGSLEAELALLLGQPWDDELEPFRHAAAGAPVRWLHATG